MEKSVDTFRATIERTWNFYWTFSALFTSPAETETDGRISARRDIWLISLAFETHTLNRTIQDSE